MSEAAAAATTKPAAQKDGNGTEQLINPYRSDRFMPSDFAISIGEKGGTDRILLNPSAGRAQSMRGFEPEYTDIVDFIVRVTHRIWEEKEIGYIYSTYKHNSQVIDDSGLQYGRDKSVADTVHTINAFPDIRLYADEVIWAGDDRSGFHTSHRAVIIGHNTGYSRWGAPTGRKVVASISERWLASWATRTLLCSLRLMRASARLSASLVRGRRRGSPRLIGPSRASGCPTPFTTSGTGATSTPSTPSTPRRCAFTAPQGGSCTGAATTSPSCCP